MKAGAEVMARVEVMASAEIEWDQAERMQAEWLAARVGVKSRQLGMRSIPWRRQYIQRVGAQHVRYARRLPLDGVSVELQLTPQLESAPTSQLERCARRVHSRVHRVRSRAPRSTVLGARAQAVGAVDRMLVPHKR